MEEGISMPYPEKLGQPCWAPEQVRKVISLTAHTSAESAPYFLAAHSPFERITDSKSSGRQLTEEQIFQELFSSARGEVQAFVRGEPGTGKSHLIRWLKLRAEDAKMRGEADFENFKLVLVSRGNGSLKDALGQVVAQLGVEFTHHTTRIRGAIDKLSDLAARDTLLSSLALEVGTHWTTRHPEVPMPRALQHLAAALGPTTGFGVWVKREGGVVHRVIKRLTEDSSVDDRENIPEFVPADFNVEITYLRPNVTPPNVLALAEDLAEEDDLRETAARILNLALKDAVRELTGLRGSDLLEIFTEIRRELGHQKQLAVFIEDVSVTGIDQDIINAFEPREIDGLSRMVAVLGITNSAWDRFPDNQRQRATSVFEVGGQAVKRWAGDATSVATFTARYLNAVRMEDKEINALAAERFSGDVTNSACDRCPRQVECFATFGNSDLPNGTKIGLFPFNRNAPQALLTSLTEAYYESQRGLLDRVMLPALDQSYGALQANEFPQKIQFSVRPAKLMFDWAAFTALYLGGTRWGDHENSRIRFLADYWTVAASVTEAASQLKPLLSPFGFPKFSGEVAPPQKNPPPLPVGESVQLPPAEDPALRNLLDAVDTWFGGSNLTQDAEFRKHVGGMLRNSIAWSDKRGTPITISVTGEQRLISGHAFVLIDGQTSKPATQTFFFNLERNKETKELLESLANFERRNRNWEFPHSEIHKRKLSRWLRRNSLRVVESLCPKPTSLVETTRRCAIQVLALAMSIRDRRKLPTNAVDRIEALLKSLWDVGSKPVTLSSELEHIVSDLESKHAAIRNFVVREFGAGQGDAEPKDFIDPSPILKILDDFGRSVEVEPPPPEASGNFWKNRFFPVSRLEAYASLTERFRKERSQIRVAVEVAKKFVETAGFEGSDLRDNIGNSLKELVEVIGLQRGGQHKRGILPLPNEEFDQLWQKKWIQNSDCRSSWSVAVGKAIEVSEETELWSLLAFDPAKLKECISILGTVQTFLEMVDEHLEEDERFDGPEGDSRSNLLGVLKQIEELSFVDTKESAAKS